jgi:hypothetical protein
VNILKSLGYPNRVVALLSPILAPVVGAFASWVAREVPGMPKSALNEIFLAAATIAIAPALLFMHNRFKWDVLQEKEQIAGAALSAGGAATADEFADLGIEPPGSELLALAGTAGVEDDFAEDVDDGASAELADDDEGEALADEEPFDDHEEFLDDISGILDEEDDLDDAGDPDEPARAGA